MCRAGEMLDRLNAVSLVNETADILMNHTEDIVNLNRKQLLAGLNNRGEYLSPKYSEDPWFKKPGAAERYAAWKKKLFPGDRPEDVPNLTVIGVYYNQIQVTVTREKVNYDDSASFAAAIEAKYNNTALGLNKISKQDAYKSFIKEELVQSVCEKTGVKKG